MRYKCNDCGCIFYFSASRVTDEPMCPQCKDGYISIYNDADFFNNATEA